MTSKQGLQILKGLAEYKARNAKTQEELEHWAKELDVINNKINERLNK